jgi:hypothetical protein
MGNNPTARARVGSPSASKATRPARGGDALGSQGDPLGQQCHGLGREGEALPPIGRRASTCNPTAWTRRRRPSTNNPSPWDSWVKPLDQKSTPVDFMAEHLPHRSHARGREGEGRRPTILRRRTSSRRPSPSSRGPWHSSRRPSHSSRRPSLSSRRRSSIGPGASTSIPRDHLRALGPARTRRPAKRKGPPDVSPSGRLGLLRACTRAGPPLFFTVAHAERGWIPRRPTVAEKARLRNRLQLASLVILLETD